MSFKKLPPIKQEDLNIGCATCSTASIKAPLDRMIAVGFGAAFVTKNGKTIYDGERDYSNDIEPKTIRHFEEMAQKEPGQDWQVHFHGPMHGETYQRHGENDWVCVESDPGFA